MNQQYRLNQEHIHDPYFAGKKPAHASVCQRCGLVQVKGLFKWQDEIPADFDKFTCPACLRIEQGVPGGVVILQGAFLDRHKDEIGHIITNCEDKEKKNRPLERLISVISSGDKIEVTTTYEHLARLIGESVNNAFKGDLDLSYQPKEKFIRVVWTRDN